MKLPFLSLSPLSRLSSLAVPLASCDLHLMHLLLHPFTRNTPIVSLVLVPLLPRGLPYLLSLSISLPPWSRLTRCESRPEQMIHRPYQGLHYRKCLSAFAFVWGREREREGRWPRLYSGLEESSNLTMRSSVQEEQMNSICLWAELFARLSVSFSLFHSHSLCFRWVEEYFVNVIHHNGVSVNDIKEEREQTHWALYESVMRVIIVLQCLTMLMIILSFYLQQHQRTQQRQCHSAGGGVLRKLSVPRKRSANRRDISSFREHSGVEGNARAFQ